MQSVTAKFLRATKTSSKVVLVADLFLSDGRVLTNLPVDEANVSSELDSDITRSATITTADLSSVPGAPDFGIDFLSCEVTLRAGYVYSNQQVETADLGRFMVWNASKDYANGDVVSLELYDRAKYMEMSEIVKPLDYSGFMAQTAIQDLVNRSIPGVLGTLTVTFSAGVANVKLGGGMTYDTNHLDAAIKICDSIGAKLTFDTDGQPFVVKKPALDRNALTSTAVFELACGPNGNLIDLSRQITRENVFNGVAVYGTAPEGQPQPFGEAYDMNTSSKTYWNGPFGKALKKVNKEELLTSVECIAAANAILKETTSGLEPITAQILPNPALEVGDIVTVVFPDLTTTELHMIASIDFDMDEMSMQITTTGRSAIDG